MGHNVAYIKDPRGGWFKVDDHKASPVFLSEVLQVQAYKLCYIHKVQTDARIDHVKQQTEQVFDSMDEDGTPDAVRILSLPESKARTEPEQIASHSAPTVEEPAEGLTQSHAVPAGSCWMRSVLEEPPTGVKNSDSNNLDPSSMRTQYLPMVCEHRKTPIFATAGHGSTAQGAQLLEGMPDVLLMDPSLVSLCGHSSDDSLSSG